LRTCLLERDQACRKGDRTPVICSERLRGRSLIAGFGKKTIESDAQGVWLDQVSSKKRLASSWSPLREPRIGAYRKAVSQNNAILAWRRHDECKGKCKASIDLPSALRVWPVERVGKRQIQCCRPPSKHVFSPTARRSAPTCNYWRLRPIRLKIGVPPPTSQTRTSPRTTPGCATSLPACAIQA